MLSESFARMHSKIFTFTVLLPRTEFFRRALRFTPRFRQ